MLALCAKFRIVVTQTDFDMAYLQCLTKSRVFVKIPSYWAKHMPEQLRPYCGVQLRMLRCLYGYFDSGKTFWEEQNIVFRFLSVWSASVRQGPCSLVQALRQWRRYLCPSVFRRSALRQHFGRRQEVVCRCFVGAIQAQAQAVCRLVFICAYYKASRWQVLA